MSVKTILAGIFEVFSKASGYSIQFNNDIFRWMIRKRKKLAYAGYVDVHGNQNGPCGFKWQCKRQVAEESRISLYNFRSVAGIG